MLVAFLSSDWGRMSLILAPLLLCLGLYAVIDSRGVARLGRRWLMKGSPEPSDAALFLLRLVGIMMLLMVLALALFLLGGAFLYHYE